MQRGLASAPAWADFCVVGASGLLLAVGGVLIAGVPVPMVHDEFAYLFMAETFASWRLSNPTPPFWEHLEAFHVLMTPSFMGKYPPAQGLVLAVGSKLGHPIVGVWLGVAFMGGAITWMSQAWLPRRWAVLAGMAALLQVGVASYWVRGYWGGALAAGAGALVYGAVRRGYQRPSLPLGITASIGLLLLANTRPLEGLLVSLPALFAVLRFPRSAGRRQFLGAMVFFGTIGALGMGAYNHAVLGTATEMPYQRYQAQYAAVPNLIPMPAKMDVPEYRNEQFELFWAGWDRERYENMRQPAGFAKSRLAGLIFLFLHLGGGLVVGVLFVRRVPPGHWKGTLGAAVGLVLGVTLLSKGMYAHYFAPAYGPLVVLAFLGWRWGMDGRRPLYRRLGVAAAGLVLWTPIAQGVFSSRNFQAQAQHARAELEDCLATLSSRSLVLVDYGPSLSHRADWIRNAPDPFSSDVVWARALTDQKDSALLAANPDRFVYRARIDGEDSAEQVRIDLLRPPLSTPPQEVDEAHACTLRI